MKLVEGKEIDLKLWEELVESSPVASWFQTEEAFAFYDGLSFLEAFAYAVEAEGQLKGVMVGYVQKDGGRIKSFLSRRAIINGGPLVTNDIKEEELVALLDYVKNKLKNKAIYIETRNFNDFGQWRLMIEKSGFVYEPHYDILVDTSSVEVVNENLGKSRKRDIRVSLRDGANVVSEPTWSQVEAFYCILENLYKTKVKTPLFPIEFFRELYALSSSAFLLVEYLGEIIGGTVCVGLHGKVLHEMFACGKDGMYKNIFPSELATYSGLQYAAEKGYGCFDMMGAGSPEDGGYGVRDFKLKFGGELLDLGRFVFVAKPLLFAIGKLGVRVLKKI